MPALSASPVVLLAAGPAHKAICTAGALWEGDASARAVAATAAAFSPDGAALAVAADPKLLLVLVRDEGDCFRTVLKVLAADRFGDVHAVPVPEALAAAGGTSLPPPCAIRTLPDDAPPLLGHFSTVTDIAATATLVATGDRENRVRVSHFPRAFDIQAFCMGHTSFVTRLAWTPGGLLVSGGGDGTARLWDPASGVQLGCVSFGASEAAADPAVVAALTVSKNRPDIAVAVVHGASHVYILTGLAERKLRIACSFLLSDGQGGAGALATGAVFDADGLLWVSARHSTTVAAYEVPAPSADGAVDEELVKCVKGLTVGGCAEGGAGPSDRTRPEVQTPGDWLASLRKNVYNPEWKGKKRRRGGDEGENEGDDE